MVCFSEVFAIVRAVLCDPDVLCAFRPLALVPRDMKPKMNNLLRLWQRGKHLFPFSRKRKTFSNSSLPLSSSFQGSCAHAFRPLEAFAGGLPSVAEMLELPMACDVYRPLRRTLILGNSDPTDPKPAPRQERRMQR